MTTPTSIVKPEVVSFFDPASNTLSYLVKDPAGPTCAIVDSVMDLDYPSGTVSFTSADRIIAYVREQELKLKWILETHVHADHLSAAPYIKRKLGGNIAIGSQVTVIQETFGEIFNSGPEFARDGSQFDQLLNDGDSLTLGGVAGYAMHTPGHTPACMTYVLGDAVFVGDTVFMPDAGTARVDFPGGDAKTLYHSIERILSLPPALRVFVCHDYLPDGRDLAYQSTIGEQLASNIHVNKDVDESSYVTMREARDATLGMPAMILPSLQINMRAGHLPPAERGQFFLKLPLNAFGGPSLSELEP